MPNIYQDIVNAAASGTKMLAALIDPDKIVLENLPALFTKIHSSKVTHIFVGGSTDPNERIDAVVAAIKQLTHLPVILFPGDYSQITNKADGILFLSLMSGRNVEYLIEQQIKSVPSLKNSTLEIIPTAYLLIDGGAETAVARISETEPISQDNIELITHTALAGEYSGKQLIYLEAGSGANIPIQLRCIKAVKRVLKIPLIVGGGVRTKAQLENAYAAGADMVVIGTAFEENEEFFNELKK